MIETLPKREATLGEFLATRARSSSDSRLALDSTGGFIVATSAALWRGPGWFLITAAGACFFAFGLWGIADRELSDRGDAVSRATRSVFRAVQGLAMTIGAVAVSILLVTFLGIALGRLIS